MISKICGALVVVLLLAGVCLAAEKTLTDDAVYNQVRIKLADDPVVKGGGIDVEVKQGVVTLSGTVELQVQIEKATKVAKKVKGVKEVINHLEIRNKSAGK
jgi:osmotically-inducible protein OsmY